MESMYSRVEAVFAVQPPRRLHGVPADGALVAADVSRRRLHALQLNVPGGQGTETNRYERQGQTLVSGALF